MKAIRIRNPWCWLICNGVMDVIMSRTDQEYRGPLLIYAATKAGPVSEFDTARSLCEQYGPAGVELPFIDDINNGGLFGICDLVEVVEPNPLPWSGSPWYQPNSGYGLRVENQRMLNFVPDKQNTIFPSPAKLNSKWASNAILTGLVNSIMSGEYETESEGVFEDASGSVLLETLTGRKQS